MRTLKYIFVVVLLLCTTLTSCTPDDSVHENEILHTEVLGTKGGVEELDGSGDLN